MTDRSTLTALYEKAHVESGDAERQENRDIRNEPNYIVRSLLTHGCLGVFYWSMGRLLPTSYIPERRA